MLKKREITKSNHPQYGTSKLEQDFAHNFLDKLGLEYEYQFEAKDIGRFYDFWLPKSRLLIEVDGNFWHGNPEMYTEENLRYHQKKAKKVDELKDKWALIHGIPIIRFWEKDIRENPKKVMKELKERLHMIDDEKNRKDNKRKRNNNVL